MMMAKRVKVIMDFDGTLTDEGWQAQELAVVAKGMLAKLLGVPLSRIETVYQRMRQRILRSPVRFHWEVNGLPATYAYEGAYLLNTAILQEIVRTNPKYLASIRKRFPADGLDPVTSCTNYLFHRGTFRIQPHFLEGVRELLLSLIEHPSIDPLIMTNSETRKIVKNLRKLRIGGRGVRHSYPHEIEVLGDTRQYHMDSAWKEAFDSGVNGTMQILPVNDQFSVDLRRPVYHAALRKVMGEGHDEIVVVADGFSLAGALPLCMGLRFILKKTDFTPTWTEEYVSTHPKGAVVSTIEELHRKLLSIVGELP